MEAQRSLSDDLMALKRTDSLQGRLEMDGYTRWKEVNLLIEAPEVLPVQEVSHRWHL